MCCYVRCLKSLGKERVCRLYESMEYEKDPISCYRRSLLLPNGLHYPVLLVWNLASLSAHHQRPIWTIWLGWRRCRRRQSLRRTHFEQHSVRIQVLITLSPSIKSTLRSNNSTWRQQQKIESFEPWSSSVYILIIGMFLKISWDFTNSDSVFLMFSIISAFCF